MGSAMGVDRRSTVIASIALDFYGFGLRCLEAKAESNLRKGF